MRKNQKELKINQAQPGQPADFDFNTPTPPSLKRKMVNWKDFLIQLMNEFPQAEVGMISPPLTYELLDFRASSIIVRESRFERAVSRRARQLERLAWFRNADIKFGLRRSKNGWQRATA